MNQLKSKIIKQLLAKLIVLLLISTTCCACKKDEAKPEHKYLIESTLLATVNKSLVQFMANQLPPIGDTLATRQLSDVSVYKITYRTKNFNGVEIVASGAFLIPLTTAAVPILSYQHGTLTDYNDAPSNYTTGMETKGLGTMLCSAGYIVSVPDYIGYGVSANIEHPYEHGNSLAIASFDMLMAVKEFLIENEIAFSNKLFLAGYSEGGFATMALNKYIDENSDLQVTLCAPASGAYNKTAFAKNILQRDEDLNFLPNFMWVFHSYNRIYNLDPTWSLYVNEPYATTLENITNPFEYGSAYISLNPQELFTMDMINGVVNDTHDFNAALANNDYFDWKPKCPIRLYYGTADDYVFPLNSETAYDAMYARGANVTEIVFDGLDHNTAVMPYILDMFSTIETLK